MDDSFKVWNTITDKLRFFLKQCNGTPWHVNVYVECGLLNVSEGLMRGALVWLAQRGLVSLTTWSYALYREAYYWEFPTLDAFFHNRDDCNYVRVKPLVAI